MNAHARTRRLQRDLGAVRKEIAALADAAEQLAADTGEAGLAFGLDAASRTGRMAAYGARSAGTAANEVAIAGAQTLSSLLRRHPVVALVATAGLFAALGLAASRQQ